MYGHIYALDEAAVRLTGLGTASLLPMPPPRADGRRRGFPGMGGGGAGSAGGVADPEPGADGAPSASALPVSPDDQAWADLEALLGAATQRSLLWGWLPRSDLADSEAYLFIGLPALALLALLADAADVAPNWAPGMEASWAEGKEAEAGTKEAAAGAGAGAKEGADQGEMGRQGKEAESAGGGERGADAGATATASAASASASASAADVPSAAAAPAALPPRPPRGAAEALRAAPEVLVALTEGADRAEGSAAAASTSSFGGGGGTAQPRPSRRVSIASDAGSVLLHSDYEDRVDEMPPWRLAGDPSSMSHSHGGLSLGAGGAGAAAASERSGLVAASDAPSPVTVVDLTPSPAPATPTGEEAAAATAVAQGQLLPSPAAASLSAATAGDARAAGETVAAAAVPPPPADGRATAGADAAGEEAQSASQGAAAAAAAEPEGSVCAAAAPPACERLDPAAARLLLEQLAEHILTSDIGFHSAADPLRLQKSLAALQVTPVEMRYMAAHTVLVGDPRVGELVPLEPVGVPLGAAGAGGAGAGGAGALVPPSPRSVPGGRDRPFVDHSLAPVAASASDAPQHRSRASDVGDAHSVQGSVAAAAAAGAEAGGAAGAATAAHTVSPQRLAQLHAFTAAVQSVATALSKKARMKEMMGRLLARHGTCGSSVCGEALAAGQA
ncbi:hypothetical protein GPECTOR_633g738 [Gonium pectorale]|uniref:Uncharacterized protein n=1 Tax=Gonium pectorale TaxID=33097 RepID=A0A150FUF6_GONPE|nr:hypothetical protein GPECTOR_633g738 [Gonium pectorale]|eukprot:KXZ41226.1 hypothetical protein GPECTOR_633g738 [Gonium pectorale]